MIVNEALREVIMLTRREVALNRVTLEAQFADDLPLVSADRIQLQQVCLNLIVNAIESFKSISSGPRSRPPVWPIVRRAAVTAEPPARPCRRPRTRASAPNPVDGQPDKPGDRIGPA